MITPQPAIPNAVDLAYRLWLWFDERVTSMPSAAQHTTGARMVSTSESLMECLVCATYAKRSSATRAANATVTLPCGVTRGVSHAHHSSARGAQDCGAESDAAQLRAPQALGSD